MLGRFQRLILWSVVVSALAANLFSGPLTAGVPSPQHRVSAAVLCLPSDAAPNPALEAAEGHDEGSCLPSVPLALAPSGNVLFYPGHESKTSGFVVASGLATLSLQVQRVRWQI